MSVVLSLCDVGGGVKHCIMLCVPLCWCGQLVKLCLVLGVVCLVPTHRGETLRAASEGSKGATLVLCCAWRRPLNVTGW